ncbi:MAG: DNA-processing protein DprA [Xanthomonadales bacterium]|nr:DNA-processing protein DprA [Xanthomonadales bacterium]
MNELKEWLILIRTPGLGATRLRSLLQEFECPRGILSAGRGVLRHRGLSDEALAFLEKPDAGILDQDLAWLEQPDHHLVSCLDADYPPQLAETAAGPAALFVVGDPSRLWLPQLAVVGSRSPTSGGRSHARAFTRAMAETGLTITSGLALGIDGAAHQAALDAGASTIAVCATGLDRVYPARHAELAAAVAANGALVSEFPPGTPPRQHHFPQRNRIISGLSLAVLVVEASVKSGSLITARFSAEQGRDVFAIPGSIDNPLSRGCHRLIKQGAKLVEDVQDLVSELAPRVSHFTRQRRADISEVPAEPTPFEGEPNDPHVSLDGDYRRLLEAIGYDPTTVDALVKHTGLTAEAVSSMLLILELSGLVETGPGGSYSRTGEECK